MNPVRKRRRPTNSKKGTTAICKAPNKKSPTGTCDQPYIVNKDRLKDHKFCSDACKSRANYYNKKKRISKLKKEMKKMGVNNEVDLIIIKGRFNQLEKIDAYFNEFIIHDFFSGNEINFKVMIEELLSLCANSHSTTISEKFKTSLDVVKKKALQIKAIRKYLKEKEKQERNGKDLQWAMMVTNIPNYMPIHFIRLLEN